MTKPKLFAVFAFRYDEELVPDLLKNISGIVDDYIAHDDRKSKKDWSHEGKIRNKLIKKARKAGADWVLCLDPDERLEDNAKSKIRKLINTDQKVVYGFNFRELWTPKAYRIDGVWGNKKKFVLFPLLKGQKFMNLRAHSQWHPINQDYQHIETGINLYHLKNIDEKNRVARKNLFKSIDPDNKIQKIGYDYLADETNLRLEKIPRNRKYSPPYKNSYNITQVGNNSYKYY